MKDGHKFITKLLGGSTDFPTSLELCRLVCSFLGVKVSFPLTGKAKILASGPYDLI